MSFIRCIYVFILMPFKDKLLTIEALLLTFYYRLCLLIIPFNNFKKHMGTYNEESPVNIELIQYKEAKTVKRIIESVSQITPWESKCLVQALTAKRMMKKREISITIYLGVRKGSEESMIAHAWTRCGALYITGGKYREDYVVVAKFSA